MRSVVRSSVSDLRRSVLAVTSITALLIGGPIAHAQTVDQTLDSIVVFGPTKPQGIVQTPMVEKVYYTSTNTGQASAPLSGATNFDACQSIGPLGLFCIGTVAGSSARAVLRWENPDRIAAPQDVILCTELGLTSCTAMTVNLGGNILVAGPKKSNAYSLIKVMRLTKQGECSGQSASPGSEKSSWNTISGKPYCYREYYSARPRIYDLMSIDGVVAAGFEGEGPGVLALEDPAPGQVTFYADRPSLDGVTPLVYLTKSSWGNLLAGSESVQALTLLQHDETATAPPRNIVMVATSAGKVFGHEIPESGSGTVFNTGLVLNSTTLAASPGFGTCVVAPTKTNPVKYDLRASMRTRRTFFTAGNCVAAYDPIITSAPVAVTFGAEVFGVATDFTLTGVTASPGIEIDFVRDGCTTPQGCVVLGDGSDDNTDAAARLARVTLADNAIAGWVVYKVTGMSDCRYIWPRPAFCVPGTVLDADGNPDATFDPTRQYLNITPMLPPEVVDSYAAIGALPPMLVQPDYSARKTIAGTTGRAEYSFDLLFGVPQAGLVYRDWFEGSFDIHDLLGSIEDPVLYPRCGGTQLPAGSLIPPAWDVVLNISELAPTVGGPNLPYPPTTPPTFKVPYDPKYVSVLLNVGCSNPTSLVGGRGSAFVYGFELSPIENPPGNIYWPDSRYALLMRSLARDFDAHLYTYACKAFPETTPPGPAPLSAATCDQLQRDWAVLYDKLKKCVNATDQPKNSSGANACGSYDSQFPSFKQSVLAASLNTVVPAGTVPDPFNYLGELKVRIMVLEYVYTAQFTPSLKVGGFIDPNVN